LYKLEKNSRLTILILQLSQSTHSFCSYLLIKTVRVVAAVRIQPSPTGLKIQRKQRETQTAAELHVQLAKCRLLLRKYSKLHLLIYNLTRSREVRGGER
jgi:hypothetical protein